MECVDHKEHFDEAHHTHTLRASSRVQLFAEVQATTLWMTNIWLEHAGVLSKVGAEVEEEVGLGRLEVVGLDGVDRLWEGSEGDHVVNSHRHHMRVFKVIQWCSRPTM